MSDHEGKESVRNDLDRRKLVGILGFGGISSMLVGARTLSAKEGAAMVESFREALEQPTTTTLTPLYVLQTLGVDSTNIAQVRDIVRNTIPDNELNDMGNLLLAAVDAYKTSDAESGPPPAAQQLEAQLTPWLPVLGDQVLALTGGNALRALSGDPDRDPIDWWSLVHFLSGAALGALCFDFWTTLKILIWWEIIEPDIWPGWNESLINRIMDVIIGMLGWYLAHEIKEAILGNQEAQPKLAPAP